MFTELFVAEKMMGLFSLLFGASIALFVERAASHTRWPVLVALWRNALLLGIGFAIAGLPSPLLFGVLGALFALVPIVGTTIVWVPATLWLLSQDQLPYAIFMFAWGVVVVGAVDNVLRPILISGRSRLM